MRQIFGAELVGIGKAIPRKKLTNEDLEKMVDTNDEWIISRTGIRERYVLSGDEAVSDLGVEAARQAMEQASVRPEDLDLIVMGTVTPDYKIPACACQVQDKLGAVNAGAFDVSSACTGFINALLTATQFVKSGSCRQVLVIGADATTRYVDWTDRNTCILFGDAGSAVILRRSENPDVGIQSHVMGTDGSGLSNLWIPGGGSSRPISEAIIKDRMHFVKMSGRDVFKFAIQALSESSLKVLEQEGLTPGDIKLMIPHQANIRIIKAAARKLRLSEDQVFVNIDKYGNTVAASVGLALREAYDAGKMSPGDRVLIVGFGAGLSWGATLVNWSLN
jgi:3-oxoacyl-[acyl-carrier-protein] synthase III